MYAIRSYYDTIDGTKTVRQALRNTYTSIEEGKADILGLWVVSKLNEMVV